VAFLCLRIQARLRVSPRIVIVFLYLSQQAAITPGRLLLRLEVVMSTGMMTNGTGRVRNETDTTISGAW
jgi:hypothetical protein